MKHNRPVLTKWAYRVSRALIVVLWLAHDTGCLLSDATLKDQDSDSVPGRADAGPKQSTSADTSADTGAASSSNSPPAVHGADTSSDTGVASNNNGPPAAHGADTSTDAGVATNSNRPPPVNGADASSDTGVASSSNSPPAVHGADASTDTGVASSSNPPEPATATGGGSVDTPWCKIKAVVDKYCVGCHDADGTGGSPMPLLSYEDLVADAVITEGKKVYEVVGTRVHDTKMPMPPKAKLTAAELTIIDDFVAAKAPKGNNPTCEGGEDKGR